MQVVTNCSGAAYSRTIAACHSMCSRGLLGLEPAPGHVVLRLHVAVGAPQVGPGRQPVRPVGQAPLAVEGLDVAVAVAQVVDEPLEDALVVEQLVARLVVDLEADHRRVVRVLGHDLPDHPLGVVAERRVGEVDLLPCAPRDSAAGLALAGDLGVLPHQPRRHRVCRGAEDDGDAALVGAVQHRGQPLDVEDAVLGLPGRPHRLTDPDHREVRLDHEVEVGLEPLVRLVLVVVGRAEQHAIR